MCRSCVLNRSCFLQLILIPIIHNFIQLLTINDIFFNLYSSKEEAYISCIKELLLVFFFYLYTLLGGYFIHTKVIYVQCTYNTDYRNNRRNHRTFQTRFQENPSFSIKLGFEIQIWVKHNRKLITQNQVSIFQIYPKNQVFILNIGLNYL